MSKPIELMHVYFGENKNTCGTCCNLVEVIRGRKKLRKCKAYGGFHSSKADWAKKWVAYGLYGEHVPQPMVSDTAKQIFYRVGITQEVIGCDGQMEMEAERDRYKADRDAAVNDLKYAVSFYTECFFCKYETDEGSTRCGKKDCWEWRGLEGNT